MKKYLLSLDYSQILAVLLLLGFGMIFIYSTGFQIDADSSHRFFNRQVQWIVLGLISYVVLSVWDFRSVNFRVVFGGAWLIEVLLLILVLAVGVKKYGAVRWLDLGAFQLQPSEFMKLIFIVVNAACLSSFWYRKHPWYTGILSLMLLVIHMLLIAAEPDLGSAVILPFIYLAMLFGAGMKWKYVLAVLLLAGLAIYWGYYESMVREEPLLLRRYQRDRIRVLFNPGADRTNTGHNAYQAKLAVASGGRSGSGIGQGTQLELGFLPKTISNNDFIFAVIAEETGFSGVAFLLLLYGWLLYTVLRTAFLSDGYGSFIAIGVATMFFAHIFINVGMSIGIAPVTGLSLPLVSYGGSFTLTALASLGLVQSVYRYGKQPEA